MGKKHRVLVVDDDPDILDLLKYNLQKEGFKIQTLEDSLQVVSTAKRFHPDLIILDIMMNGKNGIELCRELRNDQRFKDTYIFFLTANSQPEVQRAAIETGGDDLIEKVMGLRELSNKIRAVLVEKWNIHKYKSEIEVGDLRINRKSWEVFAGNHKIALSKLEFDLLYFFAQNPKKRIDSRRLIQNLWGSNVFSSSQSLDHYLLSLSKKLDYRLMKMDADIFKFNPARKAKE